MAITMNERLALLLNVFSFHVSNDVDVDKAWSMALQAYAFVYVGDDNERIPILSRAIEQAVKLLESNM